MDKTEATRRSHTEDDAGTDPHAREPAARTQAAHAEQPRDERQTPKGEPEMAEREGGDEQRAPNPSERLEAEVRELEALRARLVTALGRQSASLTILRKAVEEADHASELVQSLRKQIGAIEKKLEQGGRKQRADERPRVAAQRVRA